MKKLFWLIEHIAVFVLITAALVYEHPLAANALKFIIWTVFAGACIVAIANNERKPKPAEIPPMLSLIVAFAKGIFLAAYGWFGYGTLVLIVGIIAGGMTQQDDEAYKKQRGKGYEQS